MKILGIETSCDETAAALVDGGIKILANAVSSSLTLHAKAGGIIPEIAAREQAKALGPILTAVAGGIKPATPGPSEYLISNSRGLASTVDAIAVTFGPGLVGSLLVGVEAAKSLSYTWGKPIVPVNHLIGHLYSAWLENPNPPTFPLIALIVSGGHTELLLVRRHGDWIHLGGTRDDAAGEAFDKLSRLLDLGYPGGPAIEKVAASGNANRFSLPRPLINSSDFDFSFSGLKTAVINLVKQLKVREGRVSNGQKADLAAAIQEAIVTVLVKKAIVASSRFQTKTIVLGGGVAANKHLREKMTSEFDGRVCFSKPAFSIDNAAMIAVAAYFNYKPVSWKKVVADASVLF